MLHRWPYKWLDGSFCCLLMYSFELVVGIFFVDYVFPWKFWLWISEYRSDTNLILLNNFFKSKFDTCSIRIFNYKFQHSWDIWMTETKITWTLLWPLNVTKPSNKPQKAWQNYFNIIKTERRLKAFLHEFSKLAFRIPILCIIFVVPSRYHVTWMAKAPLDNEKRGGINSIDLIFWQRRLRPQIPKKFFSNISSWKFVWQSHCLVEALRPNFSYESLKNL